ncbi:hypothetical protein RV13_GL002447 [Enterococcus raffinosus]|nr:hypothetical protein RV13_GL002447 [Enterococcus raffinosus]
MDFHVTGFLYVKELENKSEMGKNRTIFMNQEPLQKLIIHEVNHKNI